MFPRLIETRFDFALVGNSGKAPYRSLFRVHDLSRNILIVSLLTFAGVPIFSSCYVLATPCHSLQVTSYKFSWYVPVTSSTSGTCRPRTREVLTLSATSGRFFLLRSLRESFLCYPLRLVKRFFRVPKKIFRLGEKSRQKKGLSNIPSLSRASHAWQVQNSETWKIVKLYFQEK